ncbi:hypothetical protein CXB51_002085 [Gossypium anomalum]|uniref:HTH La-type RNA-binding domain-containing protein n=1 Tax=Gossypium anomalum TaxID=47600 RepID=A0A8J5ZMM4_9ROSI|nr:hypothetical protein CXB51_002085 [Gossypium anomalum]
MEESQETKREEPKEKLQMDNNGGSSNGVRFKFNAYAPEFVSRSRTQMLPLSTYYYPFFHYLNGGNGDDGGGGGFDWFFVDKQEPIATTYFIPNHNLSNPNFYSKNVLTDELRLKIIKQVEYQFSDISLLANESLSRQIGKDPEGYVPISFISSTKKIKSLISNKQLLAKVLRSSSKLVVSDDGKKVKRKHPFTKKDKKVQSRTVAAENLPEDHSHQNLDKIFNVVGSVKNIQICRPQESNSPRSKTDFSTSNKLYTPVELESREIAKKASENVLVGNHAPSIICPNEALSFCEPIAFSRHSGTRKPKSILKTRKSEFDAILNEEDFKNPFQSNKVESTENKTEDNGVGSKKGGGKGRGRVQNHNRRGQLPTSPQPTNPTTQCEASMKQTFKGPRIPDGTKGFTMGRGKPLTSYLE